MPVTHRPVQRVESTTSEYFTKSTRAISTTPPWHQQFIDIFDPHKPEHSLKNNNIGDDNDMQVWAEVLSAYSTNDMLIFISIKHFPCLEVAHLKPESSKIPPASFDSKFRLFMSQWTQKWKINQKTLSKQEQQYQSKPRPQLQTTLNVNVLL